MGLLNFRKYVLLTFKSELFAEKYRKKITETISEKNHRYSILKVRYSILFETVETPRDSPNELLDDQDSQPWSGDRKRNIKVVLGNKETSSLE